MKKLIILILAAACAYGVLGYHFILMDSSIKILKKSELSLDDTFIDARGSNKSKLFLNPALLKAGVKDLFHNDGVTIGK